MKARCLAAWLWLLTLLVPAAASAPEAFEDRVLHMQISWDRFIRGYWGCSKLAANRNQCEASQSRIDLKTFKAACEESKKLFGLEGNCK